MKSSYTYSPLPKNLLKNPMETYYNPFKEIKVLSSASKLVYVCKYISCVTYGFGDEGYISFYDYLGKEIAVKPCKVKKIYDEFFKCLEKIEKGQTIYVAENETGDGLT